MLQISPKPLTAPVNDRRTDDEVDDRLGIREAVVPAGRGAPGVGNDCVAKSFPSRSSSVVVCATF